MDDICSTDAMKILYTFSVYPMLYKNAFFVLKRLFFKLILQIGVLRTSCEISLEMSATEPHWRWVNMGSGNGLVPSGDKPLPEPMLTQKYVALWHH